MPVNSMSTDFPTQHNNPTDEERHYLTRFALAQRKRLEDFEYIKALTSPPPAITTIANPGEFKGYKVGVIGGGLAGFASAFELRKLGFDITIFDALEDRIGGRVYTYYFDEAKTLYGEFGAARFPVSHETTWHYINLFGLNTRTFVQSNNNAFFYMRDARANTDAKGISAKRYIYPKYKLSEQEKRMSWQDLIAYGYNSHLFSASPALRTEILQVKQHYNPFTLNWDSQSNRKMLESTNLSEDAINLISCTNPLPGNFLYNSYIDYILEEYPAALSFLYEIIGGAAMLPLAFYRSLTDKTKVNVYKGIPRECLGSVIWKGGNWVTGVGNTNKTKKITITYKNKMTSIPICEDFDYVVCAIPFSTLRNIEINPLFSPKKMQAIKEVNYGNFHKSLLLCNRRFWEEGDESQQIIGGISFTDLPITSILYPSDHAQYSIEKPKCAQDNLLYLPNQLNKILSQESGVLHLYSYNLDATRLANLPDDIRFEEVKREIEKVHGLPEGYLNKIAVELKTVNWNTERWFRGGLCFFTPEQKRLFSYAMSLPEYDDRVFFAGEHISANHRWVQGALKSGMEAANELAKACISFLFHKSR